VQNQLVHRRQARYRQHLLATARRGKRCTTFGHTVAGQDAMPHVFHLGAQLHQAITGFEQRAQLANRFGGDRNRGQPVHFQKSGEQEGIVPIRLFLRSPNDRKLVGIDHYDLLHRRADLGLKERHTGRGFDGEPIVGRNLPSKSSQPFRGQCKRLQGDMILSIQKTHHKVGRM
jgi:hypothetical protein